MYTWNKLIDGESKKDYYQELMRFVDKEYNDEIIYPNREEIYKALEITKFNDVKVVIIGQDPYHGEGEAHGLSFSVNDGVKIPPSLANIYKELKSDLGKEIPVSGSLEHWAMQGVLLLNTVLTVRKDTAHSHKAMGWEIFTEKIIKEISENKEHVVFILWGKPAQSRKKMIDSTKHLILEAPHPSPLSSYRGFFGSKPFSKSNEYLKVNGIEQINW